MEYTQDDLVLATNLLKQGKWAGAYHDRFEHNTKDMAALIRTYVDGEIGKALTAAPAASGWQPIETAPRDATEVLLFMKYDIGVVMASWEQNKWLTAGGTVWYGDSSFTHWMPLPAAPAKEPEASHA